MKLPLTLKEAQNLIAEYGSPFHLYDEATIKAQADTAKAFPNAFGLTVRYAMKACPNATILKNFDREGLHFDASSGWEVKRLLKAGIAAQKISLSTQELPSDIAEMLDAGISVNACSLSQIEQIGKVKPGMEIGVRFNPGLGSGGTNRTNVGGPASSFGIWHEQTEETKALLGKYNLKAFRIHTHIGSGSDPEVWKRAAMLSLEIVKKFQEVKVINLGGGYKVARVEGEKATDLLEIGNPVVAEIKKFAEATGRKLHLEIEPGTFLIANAGWIVSTVQDKVSTGKEGYQFLKLDTGMTEILRPSMYGAQHPFHLLQQEKYSESEEVIVVGHCCESGDILTPASGDPELLAPRRLPKAQIGDIFLIGGTGAYCSAMPAKNYNSFPESSEILKKSDGSFVVIRQRQTLDQILQNEVVSD